MKSRLVLILIIALAFFLRIVNLQTSPPGFNADEAALGYNAYSLIQTGRDEWGQSFPLVFKSFSDYKPGLYVYLDLPFVALMGLTELAVRLPSIFLGTLSVLLIYLLSKEIFNKESIALSTAFLLGISPWHLHFSRGAWETNVATFFILLGVLFFVKGLKKSQWLFISALGFVAAIYTYQSPRVVVPLILVLLAFFYWKKLLNKVTLMVVILAGVLLLPAAILINSSHGLARFQGVSIFTDIGPSVKNNQDRGEYANPEDLRIKLFHNKLTTYAFNFTEHYLDHFTPDFLFLSGDPLGRNKTPGMGQLYLFEVATILVGIYALSRGKFSNSKVILLWLLVSPVAAALTYQTPHALRSENMVIPLTLISGLGLGMIAEKLVQRNIRNYSISAVGVLVLLFFFGRYLDEYYVHLPQQYGLEWEYGFSQAVPYVFEHKSEYKKVVITDRYDQPYILFLFYSRYNPKLYQQTAKPTGVDEFGFSTITSFDKFEFRPIGQHEIEHSSNTLFVGTPEEINNQKKPLKVIDYPNHTSAFKIVGT